MKKKLALFTAVVMCAVLVFSALPGFAEDAAPAEEPFARFTALGNDPYATCNCSEKGNHTAIDPDTVVWAAIRYRTDAQYDSTGVEYKAQFYINPAAEPCVPITYKFTKEWETAVVDLTATTESTDLDSKWNSASYTGTTAVRFDPLEPDRDSENTEHDAESGQVQKGDFIDIRWIAFFEKKEDAEAYTGVEDTPYCILDLDCFKAHSGANNLKIKVLSGDEDPDAQIGDPGLFYLYDPDVGVNTGWWLNPVVEGATIDVTFEIDKWFDGFNYFAYCSPGDVFMTIVLYNDNEDEVWTGEATCNGNTDYSVELGKRVKPGSYTLSFIGGDMSEVDYDNWFVLGSGEANEALDEDYVSVMGGATNGNTGPAPFISFTICAADPDYTPEPTKAPPTQAPTKEPTEAPTKAAATEAPTEKAPEKPTEAANRSADDQKSKTGLIIGIVAAAAVLAAAVVVIVVSSKKKKA